MFQTDRASLTLKMLRRDKEALERLAALEGEPMAVVVRRLIRDAARDRGLWPPQNARPRAAQPQEEVRHERC